MTDPDEPDVDDLLLDDDPSKPGWKRRAVGVPKATALAEAEARLVGVLQTQIPIEPLRHIQAHIRNLGLDQARWVRQAIVRHYLAEHGDPQIGVQALAMRTTPRTRDVPRDQHGQPRTRQGRKRRPPT